MRDHVCPECGATAFDNCAVCGWDSGACWCCGLLDCDCQVEEWFDAYGVHHFSCQIHD